jgi:hypothetical protein
VGVLATLHENAPSLGSQNRGKVLVRIIRTRQKDRLFKFSREGSISRLIFVRAIIKSRFDPVIFPRLFSPLDMDYMNT